MVWRRFCDRSWIAVRIAVHIHLKPFRTCRFMTSLAIQARVGAADLMSNPPKQHQNDNDDQDGADDTDAAVPVAEP